MGRIRTVKPEFWEDEKVGMLSRPARLLFLATFNLADDEGLLRWTPAFVKASVFMYDNDLDTKQIAGLMKELSECGLLFPYLGGASHQALAMIVNFRKHQRINRPQPGKLPPPSLQNADVRAMYARRDNWTCTLCGSPIPAPGFDDAVNLSIDHVVHESKGGTDYPSNLRATHQSCNKARGDREDESFTVPHYIASMNHSLNDSSTPLIEKSADLMSNSLLEGKGTGNREGNREQGKDSRPEKNEFDLLELTTEIDEVPETKKTATSQLRHATVKQVFSYYLETIGRSPKLYTLTAKRLAMGTARLADALKMAAGDLPDAADLMKAAIDEMAASDFHMGRDPKTNGKTYCEWENVFRSAEQFQSWLQRAQEYGKKEAVHG